MATNAAQYDLLSSPDAILIWVKGLVVRIFSERDRAFFNQSAPELP